jgi:hypothetical protein
MLKTFRDKVYVGVWLALLTAAVMFSGWGCTPESLTKAKDTRDKAQVTLTATTQAVAALEAELALLPPDAPGREKVAAGIVKGKELAAQAQKVIDAATAAIKTVETGQLDPGLQTALVGVPYGGLISLVLAVGFGVYKQVKAGQANAALSRVVESWEKVGPSLSDADKARAAAIQGEDVTKLVHSIKERLIE